MKTGMEAHATRACAICVQKGPDLPKGHQGGKYEGRIVFPGSSAKTGKSYDALLNDLGKAPPANMTAGRLVDCFGSRSVNVEQADARTTLNYTQAPVI